MKEFAIVCGEVLLVVIISALILTGCPTPSPTYPADRYDDMHPERRDEPTGKLEIQILQELREISGRLDRMEADAGLRQATPNDTGEPGIIIATDWVACFDGSIRHAGDCEEVDTE